VCSALPARSGLVCQTQGLRPCCQAQCAAARHSCQQWCSSGACMPYRQVMEAASWDSWRCPSEPAAALEPVPAFAPMVAAPCAAARGRGAGLPGGGRRSRGDGLQAPWAAFLQRVRERAAAAGQVSTRAACAVRRCRCPGALVALSRMLCVRMGALVWHRPIILSLSGSVMPCTHRLMHGSSHSALAQAHPGSRLLALGNLWVARAGAAAPAGGPCRCGARGRDSASF